MFGNVCHEVIGEETQPALAVFAWPCIFMVLFSIFFGTFYIIN